MLHRPSRRWRGKGHISVAGRNALGASRIARSDDWTGWPVTKRRNVRFTAEQRHR
jgi:hypothetical protein